MKKPQPLMETPVMAFVLAIVVGLMDGFTYITAKTFSTVTADLVKFSVITLTSMVQQTFSYVGQVLIGTKNAFKNLLLHVMVLINYAIGGLLGFFTSPYLAKRSLCSLQ